MTSLRYLWLILTWVPIVGRAEDRIWIEPIRPTSNDSDWYPGSIETVSGKVLQYDQQQLRWIASGEDSPTTIPAKRVIWIEPHPRAEKEVEAIKCFAEGQYADALEKLPEILQQRPPVWQQQWITMMAAVAASRCGRGKISLELVSQLDRRPLPPIVIAWLPIDWQNQQPNVDAVSQANARLQDPSPLVQLVAASWLLSSPDRSQALAVLDALTANQRSEVRMLAAVLRWRAATPPRVIEEAKSWQATVERLPLVWQVGPTKTLIDKLRSAGLTDEAAHWQWSLDLTPIHPHP